MRRHAAVVLTALFIAENISAFETAMIYAAIGDLIDELGDPVAASWLVTVYLLVSAAAAAIVARLGDIYGRRRVLLWLLAIVAVASVTSAATSYFPLVLLGRGVQGIAGAIMPLCFGLARENLEDKQVSFGVGVIVAGASSGSLLGLIVGGRITDLYGWHAVFIASAIFALLAWVAVRLMLPRSPVATERPAIDYVSAALFVPGLMAVLFAISSVKTWGWLNPSLLAIAAAGLATLALWVRHSLRTPDPLIDLRLLSSRPILIANIAYGMLGLGALQVTLIFEILLQAPTWSGVGLGISAANSGLIKAPSNIVALVAGLVCGVLMARLGGRSTMLLAGILVTAGWALAAVFHESAFVIGAILCIITAGTTSFYAAAPGVVMTAVPTERTSEATGMLAVTRAICMGIGSQLVAVLLASSTVADPTGKTAAHYPSKEAFVLTMAFVIATCLAATLSSLMLPKLRRVAQPQPDPVAAA